MWERCVGCRHQPWVNNLCLQQRDKAHQSELIVDYCKSQSSNVNITDMSLEERELRQGRVYSG